MTIKRFASGGVFEESVGYSRVVVATGYGGSTAWTAGTTSLVNGVVRHPGDAYAQAVVAMQAAVFALERAGFARSHIVQSRMYVRDIAADAEDVGRAHAEILGEVRPAATMVGVAALIDPDLLVEVELVAWRPEDDPAA